MKPTYHNKYNRGPKYVVLLPARYCTALLTMMSELPIIETDISQNEVYVACEDLEVHIGPPTEDSKSDLA